MGHVRGSGGTFPVDRHLVAVRGSCGVSSHHNPLLPGDPASSLHPNLSTLAGPASKATPPWGALPHPNLGDTWPPMPPLEPHSPRPPLSPTASGPPLAVRPHQPLPRRPPHLLLPRRPPLKHPTRPDGPRGDAGCTRVHPPATGTRCPGLLCPPMPLCSKGGALSRHRARLRPGVVHEGRGPWPRAREEAQLTCQPGPRLWQPNLHAGAGRKGVAALAPGGLGPTVCAQTGGLGREPAQQPRSTISATDRVPRRPPCSEERRQQQAPHRTTTRGRGTRPQGPAGSLSRGQSWQPTRQPLPQWLCPWGPARAGSRLRGGLRLPRPRTPRLAWEVWGRKTPWRPRAWAEGPFPPPPPGETPTRPPGSHGSPAPAPLDCLPDPRESPRAADAHGSEPAWVAWAWQEVPVRSRSLQPSHRPGDCPKPV